MEFFENFEYFIDNLWLCLIIKNVNDIKILLNVCFAKMKTAETLLREPFLSQ